MLELCSSAASAYWKLLLCNPSISLSFFSNMTFTTLRFHHGYVVSKKFSCQPSSLLICGFFDDVKGIRKFLNSFVKYNIQKYNNFEFEQVERENYSNRSTTVKNYNLNYHAKLKSKESWNKVDQTAVCERS